jgi:hypothetical protein
VSYEWDTSCADLELRRLENGFTEYDFTNFAAILLRNHLQVQATVHIETGSLRASGTAEVDHSGHDRWEGHISYGGTSAGVKNPVRYAASELFGRSPRYGGDHDYLRPAEHIDEEMVGPVSSFISRGRRTPHPHKPVDGYGGGA